MATYLTTRRQADPFTSLRRLTSMLDDAFNLYPQQRDDGGVMTAAWTPATDIIEDEDGVRIVAELPGVRPEDVRISIENNMLIIRGEKRQVAEERGQRVHRYERTYGMFERIFALPSTVDVDRIDARYDNGVLTVYLPKSERARPREVPVQVQAGEQGQQGRQTLGQGQPGQQTAGQMTGQSAGQTQESRQGERAQRTGGQGDGGSR